jgi:hypothetical protein
VIRSLGHERKELRNSQSVHSGDLVRSPHAISEELETFTVLLLRRSAQLRAYDVPNKPCWRIHGWLRGVLGAKNGIVIGPRHAGLLVP